MLVGYDRNKPRVRRAVDEKKAVIMEEMLHGPAKLSDVNISAVIEEKCRPANPWIYYALVEEGVLVYRRPVQ